MSQGRIIDLGVGVVLNEKYRRREGGNEIKETKA